MENGVDTGLSRRGIAVLTRLTTKDLLSSLDADKTGWPLEPCTGPLGVRSSAQHRAAEDAVLKSEGQALAQARAIALGEMNKGRDLL